MFKTDFLTDTK